MISVCALGGPVIAGTTQVEQLPPAGPQWDVHLWVWLTVSHRRRWYAEIVGMDAEEDAMNAYRAEATVDEDGTVTVRGVPFARGARVEILVQRIPPPANDTGHRYPLHGSAYRYDRPFDPAVDPDEWDANR